MSRIGKQNISIPNGVEIKIENGTILVKGPKGEISRSFDPSFLKIGIVDGVLKVEPIKNSKLSKSLWGTMASHVINMIKGVTEGFTKKLLISGVGFKWAVKGEELELNVGFSHSVIVKIPVGLEIKADKSSLVITGIDLEKVALFAMQVRKLKPVEPYKGKGIQYEGEVVIRKQGKKTA